MPDIAPATPGLGHNQPPLTELLMEESEELRARAGDLLAASKRCKVIDDDTAGKATQLASMLRRHIEALDAKRTERKAPFLESCRQVDGHYNAIIGHLASYDKRGKLDGGPLHAVIGMVDAYRVEQQRKADVERARLAQQAEKERQDAERLAAAAKKSGNIDKEIAAEEKAAHAESLAAEAAAVAPPPIRSDYGAAASGRTVWITTVNDPQKVFEYLLGVDRAGITEVLKERVEKLVRTGIRAVPGATIQDTKKTVIRG